MDQYLFETGNPFTNLGVGFNYTKGLSGNLFIGFNIVQEYFGSTGLNADSQTPPIKFTLTRATGAVPEPATWAMMLLGFGMISFGMRYGVRRSNAKFDLKVKRIAAGLEA